MKPIPFSKLAQELPADQCENIPSDLGVSGITDDSRRVEAGMIFVAYAGEASDGHRYITSAIEKGAILVIGEQERDPSWKVPYIQVSNSRQMLAKVAAAFYGYPAKHLTMIGVTGTDGKTTTSNLIYAILKEAGIKAGLISTVNAVVGNDVLDTGFHVTTPDAPAVQYYLSRMVQAGLTHVVLETTSHGWAQYRVDSCEFDIGVVTNITHEHLDYHKTYDNYLAAKARLFLSLAETLPKNGKKIGLSVFNKDDGSYNKLNALVQQNVATYGFSDGVETRAKDYQPTSNGIQFTVSFKGNDHFFKVPLYGEYNVSNCLAAITAAVVGLGLPMEIVQAGLASFAGIPGRMQRIDLGQDFRAFVDFAHTPNALLVTLKTAKQIRENMKREGMKTGRIIAVFGSAGLRDREKRRLMAEVSAEWADVTIITAEDPRTESLDGILAEMAKSAESKGAILGKNLFTQGDRPSAIRMGVKMAQNGDILLCCGKGHEQSMCFGTTEYAWDDAIALHSALAEHLHLDGPSMPLLPTTPGFIG